MTKINNIVYPCVVIGVFLVYGAIMSLIKDQTTPYFTSYHMVIASICGIILIIGSLDHMIYNIIKHTK